MLLLKFIAGGDKKPVNRVTYLDEEEMLDRAIAISLEEEEMKNGEEEGVLSVKSELLIEQLVRPK